MGENIEVHEVLFQSLYILSHEDQFTSSTGTAAFFTCALALSRTKMVVMSAVKVTGTITWDTS